MTATCEPEHDRAAFLKRSRPGRGRGPLNFGPWWRRLRIPRVQIRLLGTFSVSVDGRDVAQEQWPSLRSAQLVQLLGLAQGHRLPREQVIDTLWPQLDPEAGGANLRKAAHHAREALGLRDAVVLQGGQVALCPSMAMEVDVARFERLADEALPLPSTGLR